jgi:dolichol-phosphate mannosyltransferase
MMLSIVIPVYNEEKTIFEILYKISKQENINKEVILVDDGSNDNSRNIISNNCKHLIDQTIFLDKNYGKGYACRIGIKKSKGDVIIIQDADLEYNPENYQKLLIPFINKKTKAVYGSRVLKGGKRKRPKNIMIWLSKLANYFLTFLSNFLNGQNLTDAHTCYKLITRDVMENINLVENGFNFCPELTAKISKQKIKIIEIPIDYYGRTHSEGKKISIKDGFSAIYATIRYNIFN